MLSQYRNMREREKNSKECATAKENADPKFFAFHRDDCSCVRERGENSFRRAGSVVACGHAKNGCCGTGSDGVRRGGAAMPGAESGCKGADGRGLAQEQSGGR